MSETSTQDGAVPTRWWLTALSVALSFVLLLPGSLLGLVMVFLNADPGTSDVVSPEIIVPTAAFGAFVLPAFLPHLILKQGADHRLARWIFFGLCALAVAGLLIDDLADRAGMLRGQTGLPTGRLVLLVSLGLAGAIGGAVWGTLEASKSSARNRQGPPAGP